MADEPSAYPKPTPSGGLDHIGYRTLRSPLGLDVRQPYLGGAPRVVTINGFGTGAGAYIRNQGSDADKSQGIVIIRCGPDPAGSGSINLEFAPLAPAAGQYVALADWASCTTTPSVTQLGIGWTANRPLRPFETLPLAYQWAVSQ